MEGTASKSSGAGAKIRVPGKTSGRQNGASRASGSRAKAQPPAAGQLGPCRLGIERALGDPAQGLLAILTIGGVAPEEFGGETRAVKVVQSVQGLPGSPKRGRHRGLHFREDRTGKRGMPHVPGNSLKWKTCKLHRARRGIGKYQSVRDGEAYAETAIADAVPANTGSRPRSSSRRGPDGYRERPWRVRGPGRGRDRR